MRPLHWFSLLSLFAPFSVFAYPAVYCQVSIYRDYNWVTCSTLALQLNPEDLVGRESSGTGLCEDVHAAIYDFGSDSLGHQYQFVVSKVSLTGGKSESTWLGIKGKLPPQFSLNPNFTDVGRRLDCQVQEK